jgi:hypothetical protein
MMIIVRIFPIESKEALWNSLIEIVPKMEIENVKPLYISQQKEYDYTSIVFDAESFEAMVPVFREGFSDIQDTDYTKTSPLMSPIFFPVPKDRPEKLYRHRLALRVRTRLIGSVFDTLADLMYPKELFPTYQALSVGDDDILISLLAPDREKVESVVNDHIVKLEGVKKVKITYVNKNLRIVSGEEWSKYRESHYRTQPLPPYDTKYDWLDAAFSDEIVDES